MTWHSSLQLSFDFITRNQKTRLFERSHTGALRVQRPLYPEPDVQSGICHIYVLYPPAGIADSDSLRQNFVLNPQSHAVITTPGAGKWYGQRQSLRTRQSDSSKQPFKSHDVVSNFEDNNDQVTHQNIRNSKNKKSLQPSVIAEQYIVATLDEGAILEWLPQESIYYDFSVSNAVNHFYLAPTSSLLTWDIAVFGRQAYQEVFSQGHYGSRLQIWRGEQLLVSEHTYQKAKSRWFTSALGLNHHHVHGSFWAVPSVEVVDTENRQNPLKLGQYLDDTVKALRAFIDEHTLPVVCSHNYHAVNIRYLGADVRACFEAFYQVREFLRNAWLQLVAHRPRIWDT